MGVSWRRMESTTDMGNLTGEAGVLAPIAAKVTGG
jgi:hypothetical protein